MCSGRRGVIGARAARAAVACVGAACAVLLAACRGIDAGPGGVASIGLDPLVSPSVVAGDSLRDTLGVARPLRGTAYGTDDEPLATPAVRYRVLDTGVTVDSLTGFVVAHDIATTSVRIIAEAAGLQTNPTPLFVVPAPSVLYPASEAADTLFYSLTDTTANASAALSVRLFHRTSATDSVAIPGYLVSFAIESPVDTELVRLVGDDGRNTSLVDTTDLSGVAGRRVRLRPILLPSPQDSVVVLATAKYRGAVVPGSPVRLVLQVRPRL